MKELEKIKKNRDQEIKKLKKRIDEVQKANIQVNWYTSLSYRSVY